MKCLAIAVLGVGAFASCENVAVQREEVWVRHDAQADRIDFLYLYDGVSAAGSLPGAEAQVEALLEGKRRFGMNWLYSFDLEELDETATTPEDEVLLEGIAVEDAYAFRNEEGELSLTQHVRAIEAAKIVARLNEAIREWAEKELEEEGGSGDEVERRLAWQRAIEEGWEFVRFDGPQLVVQFPVTPEDAAELRPELARAAEDPNHPLRDVTASSIEAGRAKLTFGTGDARAWSVPRVNESRKVDPALLEALVADGHEVRDDVHFEEVLAAFLGE